MVNALVNVSCRPRCCMPTTTTTLIHHARTITSDGFVIAVQPPPGSAGGDDPTRPRSHSGANRLPAATSGSHQHWGEQPGMPRQAPQNAKAPKTARNPQNAKPASSTRNAPQNARATSAAAGASRPKAQSNAGQSKNPRGASRPANAPKNKVGFDVKVVQAPPQPAPGNEQGAFGMMIVDPASKKGPQQTQSNGALQPSGSKPVPIVKTENRSRPPAKQKPQSMSEWFGLVDNSGTMFPTKEKSVGSGADEPAKPRDTNPAKLVHDPNEGLREYQRYILKEKEWKRKRGAATWDKFGLLTVKQDCVASSGTVKKVSQKSMVSDTTGMQLTNLTTSPNRTHLPLLILLRHSRQTVLCWPLQRGAPRPSCGIDPSLLFPWQDCVVAIRSRTSLMNDRKSINMQNVARSGLSCCLCPSSTRFSSTSSLSSRSSFLLA